MDESVTITAVHNVAYGREEALYDWATSLLLQAERSTSFLGGGILGPPEVGGEWHVIYRWANQNSARWWEEAATQAGWMDQAESFARPIQVQQTTGFRAWFESRARVPSPPPKWKLAVVSFAAVFPPVLVFNLTLIPHLLGLSVVLRSFALCVGVTIIVTWVMMPRLTRVLRFWLQPSAPAEAPRAPQRAPQRAPAIATTQRGWEPAVETTTRRPGRHAAPPPEEEQPLRQERSVERERESRPRRREAYPPEPGEREARTHRSAAQDGRAVLNLVRDGDSARPRTRQPSSRDPRSSYLRRETG